jgi:hypothetical protein
MLVRPGRRTRSNTIAVRNFVFKLRPPNGKTMEEYRQLAKAMAITQIIHRRQPGIAPPRA